MDIHELNKIEIDINYLSNWTLVIPKTTVCKKYILLLHTHKTTGNPLKIHTIEYSYVCERLDHYKIVYCTFWWKIGGMYETVIWLAVFISEGCCSGDIHKCISPEGVEYNSSERYWLLVCMVTSAFRFYSYQNYQTIICND